MIAAVDAMHSSWRSALETRRDALKSVWNETDRRERRSLMRDIWDTYKDARRDRRDEFRDARKAAWRQFKADYRACDVSGIDADAGSELHDNP